jgi:AsmA protein
MKAVRYLAYAVAGLLVLVVAALGGAVAIVDGKFVMGKAERWLKEEKQRTLKVEGEPKLSLFPVLRLALGKTTLSEPKSDKVFISLDSMQVAVKVMPLLARELSMEVFSVAGFKANIVKEKDGRFNFEDLAGKRDEQEPTDQPPKVRIAAITIENAQLTFTDEIGGRSLAVSEISMKAGGLADDQPGPLSISATVRGKKPEVALKVLVGGTAMINLARQAFALAKLDARVTGSADTLKGLDLRVTGDLAADRRSQVYTVDTLNLQAKGMLERDLLAVALSAPKLRITSSKAEGQAVSGTLSVKGPQRNVDAKLSMAAVEGSA